MNFQPKKFKYKKVHTRKIKFLNYKANKLAKGQFGLKALEHGFISAKQIESARQAINRKIKRKGKIWIKIFPFFPVTKKPSEVRMGKGRGNIDFWTSKIKGGTILFEITGVTEKTAFNALKTGKAKLSLKTKIIK